MDEQAAFPNGHFYSPVVDREQVRGQEDFLWSDQPYRAGIDYNDWSHRFLLWWAFPRYLPDFDYPDHLEETAELEHYYIRNTQFSFLDARALFVLLRHWRPRRMIEVGSGFSSLLTADVNTRFLNGTLDFKCIEPYPREFLNKGIAGLNELIVSKVEDVPLSTFEALRSGDVLFIDSSHVAKTGSDCNYLFFEVLPRLRRGVRVHVHDVFLPHEYPKEWVLSENRSWNEQYILKALLMGGGMFRVDFGSSYAFTAHHERLKRALNHPRGAVYGGGSIWLRRI